VEDRITPFLYLELTDEPAAAYGERRAPVVLDQEGVDRASWWESCVPGRTEFDARMDDFATLGLYECDHRFAPVEPPDGTRALLFEHTPRPGQGTLGGPTLGLELVMISPRRPEDAQALRDWGDFIHIHDIAAASPPRFTMITPYENVTRGEPRYLHLYELDTDDPEPAFTQMTPVTRDRIGAWNTHPFDEWAWHPALVIEYVNTFRLIGERGRRIGDLRIS
jgi:hypothetical protein